MTPDNSSNEKAVFSLLIKILTLILTVLILIISQQEQASAKAKLSRKKVTLSQGKSITLKLTGTKKKAKWSVKGSKIVSIKTKGRKKHKAIIKARKKAGKCIIKVKVGKRTLKCRVKVRKKKSERPDTDEFIEKPLNGDSTEISGTFSKNSVTGKASDGTFISAMTGTSVDMLRYLAKSGDTSGNLLISPDSILTAMAMTESGASGNTLAEMEKAFGGIDIADYKAYLHTLNKRLTDSEQVKYNVANSIWYKNSSDFRLDVKKDFIQSNVDYFDSSIFSAPFTDLTTSDINNWVYNKTRGMIPSIVDSLNEETVMLLINAIAFEGNWEKPYFSQEKENFTKDDGTVQKVNMLNGNESTYVNIGGADGFVKYYEGREIAFLGLETPEGETVDSFIDKLTGADFVKGYADRKEYGVSVRTKLPEFKYDYDASLTDTMKHLGIKDAFSGAADFRGISNYPVLISDILHKTHIEVDKDGTRAAAATAVVMEKNSAIIDEEKFDVFLNHPFVYAIIDTESGIPLFIGAVRTI